MLAARCVRGSALPSSLRRACASRPFSSATMAPEQKLKLGYVPEHFSAPLHFACSKFGLDKHVELTAFPSGTGTMIEAFKEERIDVGIGLTEAWVAGMAKDFAARSADAPKPWQTYHIDSTYVESPLRWALSTGAGRDEIKSVQDLKGKKVGVSRMGSGSHIMSTVLADKQGWLDAKSGDPPFEIVVCGPFADLRAAVNSGKADFFMWEHFTTKKFWDNGELKRVGEIATPWNGWHITARGHVPDPRITYDLYPALAQGVKYFRDEKDEAVKWICDNMEYSRGDAEQWYGEVVYPQAFGAENARGVQAAVDSLKKAGVISSQEFQASDVLSTNERRLV